MSDVVTASLEAAHFSASSVRDIPASLASAAYARVQLPGVPLYWGANALQTVCDGLQDTRPGNFSASSLSFGLSTAAATSKYFP